MSELRAPFRAYVPGTQPDNHSPNYGSTGLRHPVWPLLKIPQTITELTGPQFSPGHFPPTDNIAVNGTHEALGERIIVEGHVRDEDDRPVANTMVEIWQANAAGRYHHPRDTHGDTR